MTGSHIKQIDVEGPSPVETLNKADLEKSGFNSVADVTVKKKEECLGSGRCKVTFCCTY